MYSYFTIHVTHCPQWHLLGREQAEVDLGQFYWWLSDQLKVSILLDEVNSMFKQKQSQSVVSVVRYMCHKD